MTDRDCSEAVLHAVTQAIDTRSPVQIRGGGSKDFYGGRPSGALLDISEHSGIISYEPSELIITVRAGTTLSALENALDDHGQMLPFEPPHFGDSATIGGTIACGLSGPRRPWAGAARDLVLGTRIINGRGEHLRFGGEVMKNVAGYDVSRLMTGALGTLGVILDISMKVLPKPEVESTLVLEMGARDALDKLADIGCTPCPLSAAAHVDGHLYLRLSGSRSGVAAAQNRLGGEVAENDFWSEIREHRHSFFDNNEANLWRLSTRPNAAPLADLGAELIDWGGAQRWIFSNRDAASIRRAAEQSGGHAQRFRCSPEDNRDDVFHPLASAALQLQRSVKRAFDPHRIFNPGRLYAALDN